MSLESCPLAEFKYAIFSRTGRKDKKLRRSNLFPSTIFKHGLLEGSTIFLRRSSPSDASFDSSRLAELKYTIFSRTGSKIKKLRRSKLFLSMVFKHGLLEGSTFLFRYTYTNCTPLESSRVGVLKYAISAGYDIRLKNESL